ncbi:MAG: glycosyltransferase family 39 protein [Pseudobdellovibrionaceae bacterium]
MENSVSRPFNSQKFLWIFIGILFLRAVFALSVGYVDDDAYHWSWTQQMDWSYFDHPGMIAWLEWISTSIFGHNRLGIRLPSFICFSLVVFLSWKLVRDLFDEWAATFTAGLILFVPLWGFGGHVSSPEPPFILLWVLAVMVFWNGVREDAKRWSVKKTWLWLGVIMGLGFNTKFPMILIAPGFGLYMLLTPSRRKDLLSPWPWIGVLIATAMLAPVIYWNLKYDWPSFKYQFSERHKGEEFSVRRWLGYFGMQIGLLSPGVYFFIVTTLVACFQKFKDPRWRLLTCLCFPTLCVFYPQPLWADFKPHWVGPAYLILSFGMGGLWSQGWQWGKRQLIQPHSRKMLWSCLAFLIPMNVILIYGPVVYPWVPKVVRAVAPDAKWDLKNDPSNELFGWPEVGEALLKWQSEIEAQTGKRPFMAGHRYEMTAQIWKATMQRTYMLSTTWSHYTFKTTPEEIQSLLGQDALMVGNDKYSFDPLEFALFDSCEKREYPYHRADELARVFTLYWCKNFQGIKQ